MAVTKLVLSAVAVVPGPLLIGADRLLARRGDAGMPTRRVQDAADAVEAPLRVGGGRSCSGASSLEPDPPPRRK